MKYKNVYQDSAGQFFYLLTIRGNRFIEGGFLTDEAAAWQCDRAKWLLNCQGLTGRKTSYNFPERVEAESDSAWSVPVSGLWDFAEKLKFTGSCPVASVEDAARLEDALTLADSRLERERLLDEATKRRLDERVAASVAELSKLVERQRDILKAFDSLSFPKSTKERNSLAAALGLLCSRLAQLS